MLNKHPFDWIGHFGLHLIVTFMMALIFGPAKALLIGCTMGLTIEGTQIEAGIKQPWWDTAVDLLSDAIGIGLAILLAKIIFVF